MASLEGWGSTIELHPQGPTSGLGKTTLNYVVVLLSHSGRSVVASAPALGAGDRGFESLRPDDQVATRKGCHLFIASIFLAKMRLNFLGES